ncbi:MAG: hypothetical protein HOQ24_02350 [Mycobacteriaceae bacterium]|nr:hypothetical protein [Mycobacteriaceae bacterium]
MRLRWTAAAASLMLALAACGDDSKPEPKSASAPAATTSAASAPTADAAGLRELLIEKADLSGADDFEQRSSAGGLLPNAVDADADCAAALERALKPGAPVRVATKFVNHKTGITVNEEIAAWPGDGADNAIDHIRATFGRCGTWRYTSKRSTDTFTVTPPQPRNAALESKFGDEALIREIGITGSGEYKASLMFVRRGDKLMTLTIFGGQVREGSPQAAALGTTMLTFLAAAPAKFLS